MDTMALIALSTQHARSMSMPSIATDYEEKVEDLSDAELVTAIEQVKTKTNILQQENCMLESFLARSNKKLLNGLQRQLDQKGKTSVLVSRRLLAAASSMLSSSGQLSHRSSDTLSSPVPSVIRSGSIFKITTILEQVPRLSVCKKCEMVGRELEDVLAAIVRYRAQFAKRQSCLVAELETAKLMLQEATETLARFRTCPAEPRAPAQTFLGLLEDTLKSTDFKAQKLHLRNSALRQQYRLLRKQLVADCEFGSNMGPADLEELDIANKSCRARMSEQEDLLLKLRLLGGQYIIQENKSQLALKEQLAALEHVDRQLHDRQMKLVALTEQVRQAEEEVATAERDYTVMKTIHDTYQIPDPVDYLKKKAEIEDLKMQLKTWHRKNRVQHATLKMNMQTFQTLMQATQSQGKFNVSTRNAGRCSLSLESCGAPGRKSRVTMQDAVQVAGSSRIKTRGIAVA